MSFWDSVKKFAQPYADEEYDEYDEEMDEMEEEEEAAPRAPRRAPAFGGAAPAAPAPNFNMPPQQQPAPQGFTPPAAVNRAGAFNTAAPAARAFAAALDEGKSLGEALDALATGAADGLESTRGMQAKIGRAARLGERSIGHLDAGATSCYIILETLAKSLADLL